MGTESELSRCSIDFAVEVIEYYKWLIANKKEIVMSKQVLRSATSIGANIHEAYYAISKADFIAKMHITLKEASETEYWLIILEKTNYYNDRHNIIKLQCQSIKKC